MMDFYNLDAIITVGYRVNSKKATRFRQWATKTLKEYISKMIDCAEFAGKNRMLMCMEDWHDMLNSCIDIEEG